MLGICALSLSCGDIDKIHADDDDNHDGEPVPLSSFRQARDLDAPRQEKARLGNGDVIIVVIVGFRIKETNINVKDVAEMLLAKFADIDVDSSGTLDEGEIYRVLSEMDYTREEAECIFKQIDKNGDGTISQAEFLAHAKVQGFARLMTKPRVWTA